MKYLQTTLLLSFFAILFSCSTGDEDPVTNTAIVGNWQLTSMNYTAVTSYTVGGERTTFTTVGEASEIDFVVDILDNPKTFTSAGGYLVTLTYSLMGQEIEMPVRIEDFMGNGTWALEGDTLKTTMSGQPTDEMKVIKLTADELILEGDASRVYDQSMGDLQNSIHDVFTFRR